MAHAALDLDIRAIAIFTETGATARLLSKYAPKPPIIALSSSPSVIHRMNLLCGVFPMICGKSATTEHMVETVEQILEQAHLARRGDIVGIVAGTRTNSGSTNFMRLHVLGDLVDSGEKKAQAEVPASV
jgi:pyruvate kinase